MVHQPLEKTLADDLTLISSRMVQLNSHNGWSDQIPVAIALAAQALKATIQTRDCEIPEGWFDPEFLGPWAMGDFVSFIPYFAETVLNFDPWTRRAECAADPRPHLPWFQCLKFLPGRWDAFHQPKDFPTWPFVFSAGDDLLRSAAMICDWMSKTNSEPRSRSKLSFFDTTDFQRRGISSLVASSETPTEWPTDATESTRSKPEVDDKETASGQVETHPPTVVPKNATPATSFVRLPKAFLRHMLSVSDKSLMSKLQELAIRVHPEDAETNKRLYLRIDPTTLVNTDLYNELDRASALAEWRRKKSESK